MLPHQINGNVPHGLSLRLDEGLTRNNIWQGTVQIFPGIIIIIIIIGLLLFIKVYRNRLPWHVRELKLTCWSCERGFKVGGKAEKSNSPVCKRLSSTHSWHKHPTDEPLAGGAAGKENQQHAIDRKRAEKQENTTQSLLSLCYPWLMEDGKSEPAIEQEREKASPSSRRCLAACGLLFK